MEDVRKILAKTFRINQEEINEKTTIEQIDTWDSLTHMELIINLENELHIEFDGEEIAIMTNVQMIEKIVGAKR